MSLVPLLTLPPNPLFLGQYGGLQKVLQGNSSRRSRVISLIDLECGFLSAGHTEGTTI